MADIIYTNTITNGANDADDVMENFEDVANVVNGGLEEGNMDTSFMERVLKWFAPVDWQLKVGTHAGGSLNDAVPISIYSVAVPHGLGVTPQFVLIIPTGTPAVGGVPTAPSWTINAKDGTNFTVTFSVPGQSNNAVGPFTWIAVG